MTIEIGRSKERGDFFQNCTFLEQQVNMLIASMEPGAKSFKTIKKRKDHQPQHPMSEVHVTSLYPHCNSGRGDKDAKDSKNYNPQKLITWGQF